MSATAPDPPVDLTSAEDDPVDSAATSKGLRTFGTKIKPEQGEACIATMTQDAERVLHKCLASLISSGGTLLLATRLPHAVRYTLYKSRQSMLTQFAAYYQRLRAATAWGHPDTQSPSGCRYS